MAVVVLAAALLTCAVTFGIWATFTKNSALFGKQTALAGIYSLVLAAIVAAVAMTGWALRRSPDTVVSVPSGTEAWHQKDREAQTASQAAVKSQVPRRSSVVPPWGLLPVRVRGRDELLRQLGELAARSDGRLHVLSGLGGSGKTTVALAVSEMARGGGQAWWISARDRSSLDSGLLDLASALGITSEQLEQVRVGVRSLLDLIWERLNAATQAWVLVVDNADSPELLATDEGETRDGNGVARRSTHGLTLVTSRNSNKEVWGQSAVIHPVDPLDAQDSADVLLDLCGASAGSKQDAAILAGRLGGLPLALRAAGRYLSSTGARLDGVRTFTAYCRDLDTRFAVLQGPLVAESNRRDIVMTTWDASLDLLAERGLPQARTFMRMIGQFAPAPIPVEILDPNILGNSGLFARPEASPSRLRRLTGHGSQEFGKTELRQVVTALCDLGLLDMTDSMTMPRTGNREPHPASSPCLVAHPLVVEVNGAALGGEPAMQEAAVTTIVDLVSAAAGHADPRSPSDAATWPLLAPHLELLAASVPRLPTRAVVRFAEAADRTATGLRHGGDYAGAHHLLIRAREAVGKLAPEHPAVLGLRHSYAYVIDDLGRFSDAEAEYRSILAAQVHSLGDRDPVTLRTRSHLAFALRRQRRLEEAEAEYRQVLDEQLTLLGPEHQDTLTTRNNLGDVLHNQNRYAEAEIQYETVLEAQLRLLGSDHPRTLITRNNLARNHSSLGRFDGAEEELRTILALRRSSRGAEHPSTLATWHDLAVTLVGQGRLDEARQEFRGVLDSRRRILGETHPDTLATAEALREITSGGTSEGSHPSHR